MKELIILIIIFLIGGSFWAYYFFIPQDEVPEEPPVVMTGENIEAVPSGESLEIATPGGGDIKDEIIVAPIENAKDRVTKKPFGVYITRENSPVKPERFSGYHAGADFEIFPKELNIDVPIKSVCKGKILKKDNIDGYGGVVITACVFDNQDVTIIYGHLNLSSVKKNVGDEYLSGETIGNLGKNKSSETDGERKHLHLGIHKGSNINYAGYVFSKENLDSWIDPCKYFCK